MNKNTYVQFENNFFEKIIKNKRLEMFNILKKNINIYKLKDLLDIGTTNDSDLKSSNIFCNMLKVIPIHKSISNQIIKNKRFKICKNKSITSNFAKKEVAQLKSDLVISSATIEHVGSLKNQIRKVNNMIKLSKQYIVITTPNRFFPIEVHTKLPLIHWLPKKIFRKILLLLGMSYFAHENNLNLLCRNDLHIILSNFSKKINYKIYNIKFLGFVSNFFVIAKLKNK
jgi:hypothetical protein